MTVPQGIAALKADPNANIKDPLTGSRVTRPSNSEASIFAEQYSLWEWGLAKKGAAIETLKLYLGARLGFYAAILAGLVGANAAVASDALLQITFWVVAFLIVLVPLDALRFVATGRVPRGKYLEMAGAHPDVSASSAYVTDDRL